jgi:hypothetical protein
MAHHFTIQKLLVKLGFNNLGVMLLFKKIIILILAVHQ